MATSSVADRIDEKPREEAAFAGGGRRKEDECMQNYSLSSVIMHHGDLVEVMRCTVESL